MPATNMPNAAQTVASTTNGQFVMMSPFSGPTGSPFDSDTSGNASTGALNTGIGMNATVIIGPTAPASINDAGFDDNYTPGVTLPDGTAATTAILTAIGGGKSGAASNGIAPTTPFNAQPLLGFGNGGARDAGAGPAYTGFAVKVVTATGTVANGAAIEAGFTNRSGVSLTTGQSSFGSSTSASPAVS